MSAWFLDSELSTCLIQFCISHPKLFLQHDFFLDLLKFHSTNISQYAVANPTMCNDFQLFDCQLPPEQTSLCQRGIFNGQSLIPYFISRLIPTLKIFQCMQLYLLILFLLSYMFYYIILMLLQDNCTPLYIAAECGYNDVVKSLLAANANPNCICIVSYCTLKVNLDHALMYLQDWYTPLYVASAKGFNEVVKLLIAANADVNCICKVSCYIVI